MPTEKRLPQPNEIWQDRDRRSDGQRFVQIIELVPAGAPELERVRYVNCDEQLQPTTKQFTAKRKTFSKYFEYVRLVMPSAKEESHA